MENKKPYKSTSYSEIMKSLNTKKKVEEESSNLETNAVIKNKKPYKSTSYSEIMKSLHSEKKVKDEPSNLETNAVIKNKKPYKSTSYSEIMKSLNSQKKTNDEYSILDTYIEMIFDEAMYTHQLKLLEEKIDEAIDSNDKPLFLELSTQYAKLRLVM
ncbi:IDEAL domain-containing protein [Bacillus sp. V2I10]|uniref:IDEAL domain-containing protein n=1 Tax=Bacillus sp. V2I10 TaxID=3042276 RepID=UPI00278A8225|nr:IDEAL domain-containing protein [Bacillus sp. V2I10]MDQ0862357.1 uncharacterized protein YpiB (UPF0302 family) [Bacillus sp. V2I10]